MITKKWSELTKEEKDQVTETYISIRAEEEEKDESEIDATGVISCSFIKTDTEYLEVEI